MLATKEDIISKLRRDIASWEGFRPPEPGQTGSIGLGIIEKAFPNAVFPTGAVHEFISASPEDTAACGGFITGVVRSLIGNGGACIWVSYTRRIYPPGIKFFGIEPERIVFADVPKEKDVLWVTEEALKCEGVAVVICETRGLSFTESQRLQLAVEKSKATGFIIRKDVRKITTTACVSRWQVTSIPSETRNGVPGVGYPRWQVDLQKVRNGMPGSWTVEWKRKAFRLVLPEQVAERSRRYA